MDKGKKKHILSPHRLKLHEIIFEADTPLGKLFDVLLLISIIASVVVVMLESVASIKAEYGNILFVAEWTFTILFSIEYLLRLYSIGHPMLYARSFYGIVDLVSILPTFLSLIFPGSQYFITIRLLRMLRVFRVLKFVQYLGEANQLAEAMRASKRKIIVFLFTVVILVIIVGSLMYVIEGEENGFTNIPRSIYWAIVTLTTVGYGDISPQTPVGQVLASILMITGYGIIAVPTGIVTSELVKGKKEIISTQSCPSCATEGHDHDAKHCKYCGEEL
ncbi:MAG: ion transporter [Melioribacteraceae bacterium]|jgi:voltage-gated potassium channel|nr:ion transporter [Melioribacteraceae bacterium]